MRTLHLISSGGLFGAEQMLVNLTRASQALGHDVVVGVFRNAQNSHLELADVLAHEGTPVEIISCQGRWDRESIRKIREIIREHQVDIVHTHGYKADVYGFAAVRRLRTPIVATCHGWTEADAALTLYAWVDRFVLGRFEKVVAVSGGLAGRLRKAWVHRVTVITNGVFLDVYPHAERTLKKELPKQNHRVVGMVARLARAKGISYLLDAAREVLAVCPETLFVFVGDGPARSEFEAEAKQAGITDHVVFTGVRTDMPGVYRSFDIFVLPSLKEGMPMSLLEAMAAGLPVIATPVGAIPELVRDGLTGLLVEPADPAALRDALLRLLTDATLRLHLAREGQRVVCSAHSAEQMAKAYLGVYREVLGSSATLAAS